MFRSTLSLTVVVLLATAAAVNGDDAATVSGVVKLQPPPPPPTIVNLAADMQRVTGRATLSIQPWQVAADGGLADCVITLTDQDRTRQRHPKPLRNVVLEKQGPTFVPRVLVVTPGTEVTYRNRNSPCRCFGLTGRKHRVSTLVAAGEQLAVRFDGGSDICEVTANLRPYMQSWVYVAATPHYAQTDKRGAFTINPLPAGTYRVRVWHPVRGYLPAAAGPSAITLADGEAQRLQFVIHSLDKLRRD